MTGRGGEGETLRQGDFAKGRQGDGATLRWSDGVSLRLHESLWLKKLYHNKVLTTEFTEAALSGTQRTQRSTSFKPWNQPSLMLRLAKPGTWNLEPGTWNY